MINKKQTDQMLFLADYFVNGNIPDGSDGLRKSVLKNFGEDYVGQKEVSDPGFFNAVKRVFGWGGSHVENVSLKDKMEEMSDDDLRTYLDEKRKDVLEVVDYGRIRHRPSFLGFTHRALEAFDYFDHYIHNLVYNKDFREYELQKGFLPSAKTQLELWEAIQEFSQTKFAKLYQGDLSGALAESAKEHRVPPVLSEFFELAKTAPKDDHHYDLTGSRSDMSHKIIAPLVESIRESDGPTLQAITNYLKDNNKHEVFSEQRSSNFGEYLMMAYANQAEKNREETKSKSRMERLERGSVEGEKDERNETKETQKSTHSAGGKIPMLPKSNSGR